MQKLSDIVQSEGKKSKGVDAFGAMRMHLTALARNRHGRAGFTTNKGQGTSKSMRKIAQASRIRNRK